MLRDSVSRHCEHAVSAFYAKSEACEVFLGKNPPNCLLGVNTVQCYGICGAFFFKNPLSYLNFSKKKNRKNE